MRYWRWDMGYGGRWGIIGDKGKWGVIGDEGRWGVIGDGAETNDY